MFCEDTTEKNRACDGGDRVVCRTSIILAITRAFEATLDMVMNTGNIEMDNSDGGTRQSINVYVS